MAVPRRGRQGKKDVWVGSSSKTQVLSIEGAVADAYAQAKPEYPGKAGFVIETIYVVGNNPITEYLVKLVPAG